MQKHPVSLYQIQHSLPCHVIQVTTLIRGIRALSFERSTFSSEVRHQEVRERLLVNFLEAQHVSVEAQKLLKDQGFAVLRFQIPTGLKAGGLEEPTFLLLESCGPVESAACRVSIRTDKS